MAIQDALPDRPLTFDEFQKIQQMDSFDGVQTVDKSGDTDVLFIQRDGTEYTLHYTDDEGWHICDTASTSS
ncbi:hypothetical protein [Halorussus sp. AFM4]|uniref:hypothetical protein n=1 Tax=Halorussus sp. AFM4 TaxID=3421651 RepID=UPI003EC0E638